MTSPMTSRPAAAYVIWPPPAIVTLGGPRVALFGPPPLPTPTQEEPLGAPSALGVSQVLLGTLQVALGGSLLVALRDPLGAQLGTPLGTGPVARAALALAVVASVLSFLALGLQGLLLIYSCISCFHLGPPAQRVLLGTHLLVMTSSAAGAGLAVIGAVAASRARPKRSQPPVVIYQTALPAGGAGLAEATPTGDSTPPEGPITAQGACLAPPPSDN
ncbi:uncharacterized protein LOC126646769 [Myiozetetes cayanensis]|uniref:uncharacterized protein LOC126646769 n=1 Tax=Myiozetetes cayanensis TaxID=478635 RepID=UPI0021605C73|nr:uncharacterized protein LOC126646769 [Myiozetetes cayanensis]